MSLALALLELSVRFLFREWMDPLSFFAGQMSACFQRIAALPDTDERTYQLDLLAACTRVLEVSAGGFREMYARPEFLRAKIGQLTPFIAVLLHLLPIELRPLPDSAQVVAEVAAIYAARPELLVDLVHDIVPDITHADVLQAWEQFCRVLTVVSVNHPPLGLSSISGERAYVSNTVESRPRIVRVVRHEAAHNFPRWYLRTLGREGEAARRVSPSRNDRLVVRLGADLGGERQVEAGWYADSVIDPAEVDREARRDPNHLVVGPFSLWQHDTVM